MDDFLKKMAEILEVERSFISEKTLFREIDGWNSMVGFSIMITIEEEYGVKIPVNEFLRLNTLGELYDKVPKN
jgi:acyl carrier protein